MPGPLRLAVIGRGSEALRAVDAATGGDATGRGVTSVAVLAAADAGTRWVRAADEAFALGEPVTAAGDSVVIPAAALPAAVDALVARDIDLVWPVGALAEDPDFAAALAAAGLPTVGAPASALAAARDLAAVAAGAWLGLGPLDVPGVRQYDVLVAADPEGPSRTLGVVDGSVRRNGRTVVAEAGPNLPGPAAFEVLGAAAQGVVALLGWLGLAVVTLDLDPAEPGRPALVAIRPAPAPAHAALEEATGLDLSAAALHLATGGRAPSTPIPFAHAMSATWHAEDPTRDFAPSHGLIGLLRPPAGPGVRADLAVIEGDVVPAEDTLLGVVTAAGPDRPVALDRLRRSLHRSVIVIAGAATERSFLVSLLEQPEIVDRVAGPTWVDEFVARRGYVPAADPVAVVQAAIEAYDDDLAVDVAAFHSAASRGRPDVPGEVGHRVSLRYRGHRLTVEVLRIGGGRYRLRHAGATVEADVERGGDHDRLTTIRGRRYHLVVVPQSGALLVAVDGRTHHVYRDDGAVVRAPNPAFVVGVTVRAGQEVSAGATIAVLESMKMESGVVAPFSGRVLSVDVKSNQQVEIGAPLVRIRAEGLPGLDPADAGTPVDLAALAEPAPDAPDAARVYQELTAFLLGFDLDAAAVRRVLVEQSRLRPADAAGQADLAAREDALLDLFAEVAALYRPAPEPSDEDGAEGGHSDQEYLFAYLQWLDPDRAGLPPAYRERLGRALARYGVSDLAAVGPHDDAVVWMFRSFRRVRDVTPAVVAILTRRLRAADGGQPVEDPQLRERMTRLVAATASRLPTVADLARDVRFRYCERPVLEQAVARTLADTDAALAALAADPDRPDRDALVAAVVACAQPLRGRLLAGWRSGGSGLRRRIAETYLRRFYRMRDLRDLTTVVAQGRELAVAEYDHEGRTVHLVTGYTALEELPAWVAAVREHLDGSGVPAAREVVLDVACWRPGPRPDIEEIAEQVAALLARCEPGRPLHRFDVTVTSDLGQPQESLRTQHVTFRSSPDGGWAEQTLYRNMHPMLAKRLDLYRITENFDVDRLPSDEDVYLFHGVARENPKDVRLFGLTEIRDLAPVTDASGQVVSLPLMERAGLRVLAAMRAVLAGTPPRERPATCRLVMFVRPPWVVPARAWDDMAGALAPLAAGVPLDLVIVRVRIPDGDALRDAELVVSGIGGRGITVREQPATRSPVRPLTEYRQKVLRAHRVGAPYPFEIVEMLTPPAGSPASFPTGTFVEHDLDADGEQLVPVDRPYGRNRANVVVGLLSNVLPTVPEGATRVAILSDPTRGLGNLAEPECRRINAALALAARLRVPVEWYALSSGALIAMDSGTENMDWIALTLRRLIEHTQAGHEINVVVTGINVGGQPYWNAEATMLMHTKGILIMTPDSAMVLTGKQALDFSGGVSAEDNFGIGGYERTMGPNGQGQYWAPDLEGACALLLRHYDLTYVVPGEAFPRRGATDDPVDRDVRSAPHRHVEGSDFTTVGDVFSAEKNPERKKAFDVRSVMRAVSDVECEPLERWSRWRGAEIAVVWDTRVGGIPVSMLGLESRPLARRGFVPADGPPVFTSGTLFPQASRKVARAVNSASGRRPLVVLANLSGFDGSPESMRHWQLEYGAEIGRAVTNFAGPIVFVVISRYHGGAFVVFSKTLNGGMEIAAIEGSYASVIGGAPAAAVVFVREVRDRTDKDPRVLAVREEVVAGGSAELRARLAETLEVVRAEKLGEVADDFDRVHTIQRALSTGSVDEIIPAARLRPWVVQALARGIARHLAGAAG